MKRPYMSARATSAVTSLLLAVCLFTPTYAAVSVYWTGTITDYIYFGGDAPTGVVNGSPISGSLVFDASMYDNSFFLSGSHSSSYRYRFIDSAVLRFNVQGTEWVILGTDVDLTSSSFEPKQAFGVTSDSDRNFQSVFPGYVGEFEAGFALVAENSPFPIFDASQLEDVNFDFEHPTSGSGSLTTRRLDSNDDIVEGYFLTFTINESSSSPIPEPSVPGLLGILLGFVLLRRSRKTQAEQGVVEPTRTRCLFDDSR